MTIAPRYPSLHQLNTRVWLRRLSRERGKRATLAEIDDATIDGFALQGFDWPAPRRPHEGKQGSGSRNHVHLCPAHDVLEPAHSRVYLGSHAAASRWVVRS
jgi:hypothetical protein